VAFSACEQEEELGLPRISVDPQELSFDQGEGSQSVNLLATRDWLVQSCPEWLAPGLTEGKASTKTQTVTIAANANNGYNREGQVVFTIGLAKCAVTVKQTGAKGELKKGSGTLEDPYTVSGVIAYVQNLGPDVQSPSNVYFKGVISEVVTTYEASGSYGNATFYVVDPGAEGSESFYCFQTLYLGNRKWKSGDADVKKDDEVIVCGLVVNYKGNTPETVSKGASFVYSLNGKTEGGGTGGDDGTPKGSGTLADPYNPAGAAAYAKSLGKDIESPGNVYIKGKISNVETTYAASGSYGNATFTIVDATDGTGSFYVFQTLYLGNRKWASGDTDVKKDDEVIVCGRIVNYKGNTPETVGKGASFVYSLNGVTDGGNSGNTGTDYNNAPAKTVAEFLALKDKQTYYKLTGTVSNFNPTYCSFDLTDATGTIYVYSVANKSEWSGKISNEATVVLAGLYSFYEKDSKDEVVDAYILSCEGGSGSGNTGQGDTGQFSSNVSWAKGSSCYDDNTLNVNGVQNVANLKFGTSSKFGDATVTLPAGTKEVTFYAIAWKGKPASLKFTVGSKEYTFDVAANDGAANTSPYNVTVTDSDKYTLKLDSALASDQTVKVETFKGTNDGTRAFLFGVQAVK
jgi:RPA family protein